MGGGGWVLPAECRVEDFRLCIKQQQREGVQQQPEEEQQQQAVGSGVCTVQCVLRVAACLAACLAAWLRSRKAARRAATPPPSPCHPSPSACVGAGSFPRDPWALRPT